jgi:molybdenum cofactor cytidylyltransferase
MVPGIVLAGGWSSRMKTPKALLPVGAQGETFLERIIRTLLQGGVSEAIAVVGANAEAIRAGTRLQPRARLVTNADFARGQLTSLLAGLREVEERSVSGVLVTLVDVPLVSALTVRTLLGAHEQSTAAIVRPISNGRHGHPVIFHQRIFDELRHAAPEVGAKSIVRAYAAEILEIPVDDEGAFIDIDTPEEYERWVGPLTSR